MPQLLERNDRVVAVPPAPTPKARIFIIEDEAVVIQCLKRMLLRSEYAIAGIATTGAEALSLLASTRPDLVLTDIMLGAGPDGIELAERIRREFNLPVVYVTGLADEKVLERAKLTEPFGYVIKPFRNSELCSAVELALYKHRVECKLQESEHWLSTIFQSIGDGVIATDTEARIKLMNPVAEALTGVSQQEAVGRDLDDIVRFIDANDQPACERALADAIMDGHAVRLDLVRQLIARDGTCTPVDADATPIRDHSGGIIGGVITFRDVTERRRAELLAESRQFLQSTLDALSAHIAILDASGTVLAVNDAWRDFIADATQHCLRCGPGENYLDSCAATDTESREVALEIAAGTRDVIDQRRTEFCFNYQCHCTETPRWFQMRATRFPDPGPVRVVVAHEDITERRRAEEEMRHYAGRLHTLRQIDRAILCAQSPAAIARAVLEHVQQLLPCVAAAVVEFDIDAGEAVTLACLGAGSALPAAGARLPLEEISTVADVCGGTMRVVPDFDGVADPGRVERALMAEGVRSYVAVPLVATGNLVVRGAVIGALFLGVDTARAYDAKQIEMIREVAAPLAIAIHQANLLEQVQRYAEELEQRVTERTSELSEINAELEAFTYSVSHDLRTPLWAMELFAEALLNETRDTLAPTAHEYVHRIRAAARQMDTLITDLLAYSRLTRGELKLTTISLDELVANVRRQLETEIDAAGAAVDVASPFPLVVGHDATLVQVLTNLLTNAVKFTAPGQRPEVRIRAEAGDNAVRLWIEDNGIGIAPEHRERIFGVFERLHGPEQYPGTGIGLAIVRKGITRMGGAVGVESQPGQGSRFWVELPKGEIL